MATPVQSQPNASFKPFAIVIKNHYQPTYSLRLIIDSANMTIGKLKSKIEQQHKGNPLIQDQLLVYRGKLLESKTNLFQLLQSSIIQPTSPTNHHIPDEDTPSMYIHMTLRGGSDTATKIGLTQNTPEPPKNPPKPVQPPPPEPEPEEEQKYEKPTSSKANEAISPQFTPHSHSRPPPHPHYIAHAPQPPHAYHPYYNMPPPPPPNPYYFSHSMPDLYHPSAYAHRGQSVPSHYANPSQPFAPPTLVQQASNPHQNAPFHPMHAPYAHYMPQPHGHPPPMPQFHRFGHFGVRSHSTSDLRYLRNINAQAPPPHIVPSKIEEKDEKNEAKKEDKEEKNNVQNDDNNANAQRFGLRQRRAPNVANNENDGGNAVGNNGNDARNAANDGNNNDAVREGWFGWFFRILNINVLIRLGIFMWLFGPNLGTYRFTMLCVLGVFYYLHQIGILHRIFGRFMGRNRNRNEVQHRDPNAVNDGSENNNNNNERVALLPLNYVQLLQRFLIGIFASLWPTWDHRNVYPANRQ